MKMSSALILRRRKCWICMGLYLPVNTGFCCTKGDCKKQFLVLYKYWYFYYSLITISGSFICGVRVEYKLTSVWEATYSGVKGGCILVSKEVVYSVDLCGLSNTFIPNKIKESLLWKLTSAQTYSSLNLSPSLQIPQHKVLVQQALKKCLGVFRLLGSVWISLSSNCAHIFTIAVSIGIFAVGIFHGLHYWGD